MKKALVRLWHGTALLLCAVLILSACSTGKNGGAKGEGTTAAGTKIAGSETEELKPVELLWYYPIGVQQPDQKTIEEAVNKITKEKINTTIKMNAIDFGSYEQKMNTMVAANEAIDIIWTSSWNFKMDQNVAKGVFIPLDDLINEYAPKLKSSRPETIWNFTKQNDKIYGVLSYQTVTNRTGYLVQKRYAEKYGLNPEDIKTPGDMDPFFAKLKAGEQDVVPLATNRIGLFNFIHSILEPVAPSLPGVSIYRQDESLKLVSTYEMPEFKDLLTLLHDWYNKGYINQDAATAKSVADLQASGKVASIFHNVLKPGREGEEKQAMGGNEVIAVYTSEPYLQAYSLSSAMGISQNSKNPERAMMFLELLNSDKELFNLISYGIEGQHYTKLDEEHVKSNADAGYAPNQSWVFGNVFNSYLQEGQPSGTWEETQKQNETAPVSYLTGFSFDLEPVKTEVANMKSVFDEYMPALTTGTVSPAEKYDEFINKYKKAGLEKVITEVQRQLDEWKTRQGK